MKVALGLLLVCLLAGVQVLAGEAAGLADNTDAHTLEKLAVGSVYQQNTDQLLYTETYWANADGRLRSIRYHLPDGSEFGEKVIETSPVPGLISFRQTNRLANRRVSIQLLDQPVSWPSPINLQLLYDSPKKSVNETVTSASTRHVIVDAGFDAFLKSRWNDLMQGEKLPAQFPLASRGKLVDLFIVRSDCERAEEGRVCFRVRLNSFFLRMFIDDPVYAEYDRETRMLKRYRGVGNVALADGKVPKVDIRLQYVIAQQFASGY